jgi:hypothetical protein
MAPADALRWSADSYREASSESFRQRLVEDPKGTVEQELGTRLPEEVRVVAVEESADTIYLVLPLRSAVDQEAGEFPDWELESVAGGGTWSTAACGYSTPNCGGEIPAVLVIPLTLTASNCPNWACSRMAALMDPWGQWSEETLRRSLPQEHRR